MFTISDTCPFSHYSQEDARSPRASSYCRALKQTQINKILTAISLLRKTIARPSRAFQFPTGTLPSPRARVYLRLINGGETRVFYLVIEKLTLGDFSMFPGH